MSEPTDWQATAERWATTAEERQRKLKEESQGRHHAEEERDKAYGERAYLIAWLARIYPAVMIPAGDLDDPEWEIIYLRTAEGQLSWHIAPRDIWLFSGVKRVATDDPRAQWDGHTPEQKYNRIQALIQWPRPDEPTPVLPGSQV